MKKDAPAKQVQQQLDFSPPRRRSFLAGLPARIDCYEEGVARFFFWRTGLDYYAAIDQIVDLILTNMRRAKVVDLLTDTGTFALRLGGRKAFAGKIYSFDSNVTLIERARQRARHMDLLQVIDFREFDGARIPLGSDFADVIVSIFDFHRHPASQFLSEAIRVLQHDGHLFMAEMLEPRTARNRLDWSWKRLHLRYVQKKPEEADGVYYDRETMIDLLFGAGFHQVVVQGLRVAQWNDTGVFSLLAAVK